MKECKLGDSGKIISKAGGGKPSGRAQVREIFMFSPNEEWLLGPAIVATPEEPEQLPKVYCF